MLEFGYKKILVLNKNRTLDLNYDTWSACKTVLVDPNTLTLCCQSTQHGQKVLPLNPNEPMKQNNNL